MGPLSTGGHHRLTHAADERAGGPPTVGGPPPHRTFPDLLERVSFFISLDFFFIWEWDRHQKMAHATLETPLPNRSGFYGCFY